MAVIAILFVLQYLFASFIEIEGTDVTWTSSSSVNGLQGQSVNMTWTVDWVNYGSAIQWTYVKIYQDPNTEVILYTSTGRRTVYSGFQSRDADLTLTASQTGTIVTVVFTMANLNKTTDQNGYKASVANDYPDTKTIGISTMLTVLDKSRTATLSSDKTSVCQNDKVNLTCTSGPANPAPSSYEFYNNGVLVGTSASNVYEATATAGLPDVNKFVCVPRNLPGGSLENGSVEVTAKAAITDTCK